MIKFTFRIFIITIILIITQTNISNAQVIYETNNNSIYRFLNRLDQKGFIDINTHSYPYSKKYIKSSLQKLEEQKYLLNLNERKNLNWQIDKYNLETGNIDNNFGEYHLIEKEFSTKIYPILGAGFNSIAGEFGHIRKVGINIEAYYANSFGIFFQYLDTGEFNDNLDTRNYYNSKTHHNPKYLSNGLQFSDVRAQINYNWDWGVISLKKDNNKWGSARYGQLALSNKTASYPHIELKLQPTDWISLNFIHGWLNSQVIDSSLSQSGSQSLISNRIFEEYKTKYITANYLTISPNEFLKISVGNSFVYSGEIRPEMFLPIMYYKVLDHNTGRIVGDGNGTLFLDLSVNYPETYKLYGTLLLDVYEVKYLVDESADESWLGFTVGFSKVDFFLDNLDLTLEYTCTDPWLYENQYEVANYKHLGYTLGHWIGQNADLLSIGFDYSVMRGFDISLTGQIFRKGSMRDIYYAYNEVQKIPFLDGEQRTAYTINLDAQYEVIYNLFIQGQFKFSNIKDEDIFRTQTFSIGNSSSFQATIAYGLPF